MEKDQGQVIKMGKKKKRRGGKSLATTVMKWVRVGALAGPGIYVATQPWTLEQKARVALKWYSGFNIENGTFNLGDLAKGWGPYLGAVLATYGIPKLAGIIRRL